MLTRLWRTRAKPLVHACVALEFAQVVGVRVTVAFHAGQQVGVGWVFFLVLDLVLLWLVLQRNRTAWVALLFLQAAGLLGVLVTGPSGSGLVLIVLIAAELALLLSPAVRRHVRSGADAPVG